MGGMMGGGGMDAWILLWIILRLAVMAAGGVLLARAFSARGGPPPPRIPAGDSAAIQQAKEALRLRYAHGEISREDYLQGKVELEDR
jgi:putative membrane protein